MVAVGTALWVQRPRGGQLGRQEPLRGSEAAVGRLEAPGGPVLVPEKARRALTGATNQSTWLDPDGGQAFWPLGRQRFEGTSYVASKAEWARAPWLVHGATLAVSGGGPRVNKGRLRRSRSSDALVVALGPA